MRNKIEFREGFVFFNQTQCYLTPLLTLNILFKLFFEKNSPSKCKELLKDLTKIDSIIKFNSINSKLKIKNFNLFLDFLNSLGIGLIKIEYFTQNQIILKLVNSNLTRQFKQIFNEKPKIPLENLHISYIENYLELLIRKKIKTEIKYNNKNEIIWIFKFEGNIDFQSTKLQNNLNYPQNKKFVQTGLITRIILGNHIKIINGNIKLWNTAGSLIPYFFLINIIDKINEKEIKILGRVIGITSVELQKKMFGIKESEIIYKKVISQSFVSGSGNAKPIKNGFLLISNIYDDYNSFISKESLDKFYQFLQYVGKGVYDASFNVNSNIVLFKEDKYKTGFKVNNNKLLLTEKEKNLIDLFNAKNLVNFSS